MGAEAASEVALGASPGVVLSARKLPAGWIIPAMNSMNTRIHQIMILSLKNLIYHKISKLKM
jgi:hypothetical protein